MDIKTTDLDKFLQAEHKYFKDIWRKFENFKRGMKDEIRICEKCGVYYWDRCSKRCNCE